MTQSTEVTQATTLPSTTSDAKASKELTGKKVKIKVLRPILTERKRDKNGILEGKIVNPGTEDKPVIIEVTEAEAKEFCDQAFYGHYNYWGNRTHDENKHPCYRAVRVG